jgi:lipopolysaccharide/colanic/teichoic acid biosynthesis glycosyltransferase
LLILNQWSDGEVFWDYTKSLSGAVRLEALVYTILLLGFGIRFIVMKRLIDIFVSLVVLLFFMPIIFLTALLVRVKLGSPVFFKQIRPGKNEEYFQMMKFRSMLDSVGKDGNPLPDNQRLTKFGEFLRASSLDELPGLWNVLRGEMCLVGPRPLLIEYLPLYSDKQARRHEVRPGITGWAQVNGRNAISWEEKFELDVWYVDHQSFWLDIKILFLTVKKVFIREGINQDGQATVEKFTGSMPVNGFRD